MNAVCRTFLAAAALLTRAAWALAGEAGELQGYVSSVEDAQQGMTLWQTIQAGGWVMVVLGVLSVVTVALVIYMFVRLQPDKLVPREFSHELIGHLRENKYGIARQLCDGRDSLVSAVVLSGLDKIDAGPAVCREAVEMTAKREASNLWQGVGYLADIAAVAPMIGLLGTVIGMIQAFNTIAFQAAVVKPILLAGGVSKAMVTTAGGMIVAIVAMIFYSFFRSRVQEITNLSEIFTTDILNALPEPERAAPAKNQ